MKLSLLLAVILASLALVALAVIVLADDGVRPSPDAATKNPFPWDDGAAQAAGKLIYQQSCASCHGPNGDGTPGFNFATRDFANKLEASPGAYFQALAEGRLDKGMPPYKALLSDEQHWQVLTFLYSLGANGIETLPEEVAPIGAAKSPLDCVSCHNQPLISHDKLGNGSEACWNCHLNTQMKTLHLANGATQFPLEDSSRLCAQCHQKRYDTWLAGTHGVPAWKEGDLAARSTEKKTCIDCHNPHRPQIVLSDITKQHPVPNPAPPKPPYELMAMVGISLGAVIVVGIAAARSGEGL